MKKLLAANLATVLFAHERNIQNYSRKAENIHNAYSFYFAPEYTFSKNWTAIEKKYDDAHRSFKINFSGSD